MSVTTHLNIRFSNFPKAWAKDEPPSPTENTLVSPSALSATLPVDHPRPSASSLSREETIMSNSTHEQPNGQSWWTFISGSRPPRSMTRSRTRTSNGWPLIYSLSEKRPRMMIERSKTFLSQKTSTSNAVAAGKVKEEHESATEFGEQNPWNFNNPSLPQSPPDILTLKQARTPGWNQPWSPRQPQTNDSDQEAEHEDDDANLESGRGGPRTWYRRRKRLRAFILNNNYVPLVRTQLMLLSLSCGD